MTTKNNKSTPATPSFEDMINRDILPVDVVINDAPPPPVSPAIQTVLESVTKQLNELTGIKKH